MRCLYVRGVQRRFGCRPISKVLTMEQRRTCSPNPVNTIHLLPTCYQNPRNLPNLNFESSFQLVLSNKLGGLATHFGNSTRISYSLLNVDRRRQSAMKSQSNKQPGSGSFRHLDKLPDGVEARDSRTIALLLKLLYKYWCNILRIFLTLFFNKI